MESYYIWARAVSPPPKNATNVEGCECCIVKKDKRWTTYSYHHLCKDHMIEHNFQKPVTFLYFWLNYCDGNRHIERTPIAVKNIDHFFNLTGEIIKADRLHLFLLSDDTRIRINT